MRQKITIAVIAVALIAAFLFLGRDDTSEAPAPSDAASSSGEAASPSEQADPAVAETGIATLASSGTLEIDRASLVPGEPLSLHLQLGDPAAGAEPIAGRLVVEGREPVDLTDVLLSAEPGVAHLELDSRLLSPGRNIIEIKTTERSHIPLRRYVVEVR